MSEQIPQKSQEIRSSSMEVSLELERIRTQIEMLNEARRAASEKLTKLSERLGEVRALIADREREIKELRSGIQRTLDITAKIEPQELLKELRSQDMKIDSLRAKLESNENLINRVIEELKEIRRTISLFRGIDQLQKMSEDLKSDLTVARRIMEDTKRHADKVEVMFLEIKKRSSFEKLDQRLGMLEDSIRKLARDLDKLGLELKGTTKSEDFEKLRGDLMKNLSRLNELGGFLEQKSQELKEIEFEELIKLARNNRDAIMNLQGDVDKLKGSLPPLEQKLEELSHGMDELRKLELGLERKFSKIAEDLIKSQDSNQKLWLRIGELEDEFKQLTGKLGDLENEIQDLKQLKLKLSDAEHRLEQQIKELERKLMGRFAKGMKALARKYRAREKKTIAFAQSLVDNVLSILERRK